MNSSEPTTNQLLRRVATHLSAHPGFLASRLVQLSPASLAALELTDDQLTRLALCRAPRQSAFLADVWMTATYIGTDPLTLLALWPERVTVLCHALLEACRGGRCW